jgi:hypothetical protein
MHTRLWRVLIAAVVVLVLALTFMAYLQPGFVVDLANRVSMCF